MAGSLRPLLALLRVDALRLVRDRFLLGLALLILGVCVALRLGIPWITQELWARWAFELEPYYVLLAGHVAVVLPTVTVAILGGFLVLEMREERVLKALLATPVAVQAYFHGLAAALTVVAMLFAVVHALIIDLALPPMGALLVIALAAGTSAPPQALFVAAASKNKVEAMAYTKLVSGLAPIALAAYFIAEPWQWLAGVYPAYWAAKAYWLAVADDSSWPLWALGAPAVSWLWWRLSLRVFTAAAYR